MATTRIDISAGSIGQVKGPFEIGDIVQFLNNANAKLKLGISIGEKDLMKRDFSPSDFHFTIDNETIRLKYAFNDENQEQFLSTKSCLYETERNTQVNTIVFQVGAPASLIIDYSVQSIGD